MNHDEHGNNSWMMWAMMLGCAMPALLIFFSNSRISSPTAWILTAAIVAVVGFHIWVMIKSNQGKAMNTGSDQSKDQNKRL